MNGYQKIEYIEPVYTTAFKSGDFAGVTGSAGN